MCHRAFRYVTTPIQTLHTSPTHSNTLIKMGWVSGSSYDCYNTRIESYSVIPIHVLGFVQEIEKLMAINVLECALQGPSHNSKTHTPSLGM